MTTAPSHIDGKKDSDGNHSVSGNISDVIQSDDGGGSCKGAVFKKKQYALLKCNKLRYTSEFREVFEQKKSYAGKLIVLYLRRTSNTSVRVGVIASKRTFRRAVDRNRAKRLMREAFRLNRDRFVDNADIVLIARRHIISAGLGDVEKDLLRLAGKAGVLRN